MPGPIKTEPISKIDKHELRLDDHDKDIIEIKETVKSSEEKIDIIVKTTDNIATTVKESLDKKKILNNSKEGTIEKGDWRGTVSAIVGFLLTAGITAWQLWSVMYGDANPFTAAFSVMMTPAIWVLIETLSGKTVKKNEVMHRLEIKDIENNHKDELNKIKGVNQLHIIDLNDKKIKIARLEERNGISEKKEPPSPIFPKVK